MFSLAPPLAADETEQIEEASISLFDGQTLEGWDGDPKFWRVEEGAITGQTTIENPLKSNTFLIWRGGELENFELTLEYRIVGGNSGIQYRCWEDREKLGRWVVGGYQADIDSPEEPRWGGAFYEEQGRGFLAKRGQKTRIHDNNKQTVVDSVGDPAELHSHVKFEDWNTYQITANGYHFVHKINGQVMIESTDNDIAARRDRGLLAFQLHWGDPMKLQLRNIRLKRLDK